MFIARSIIDPIIALAAGVLLVAYIRTEYYKPIATEAASLQYPHELGFPAWYGKGQSPHDVLPNNAARQTAEVEQVLVLHDSNNSDMTVYAMVDYFKRMKPSELNISVISLQEYSESLDESCPWDWILTIGSRSQVKNLATSCRTVPVIQYEIDNTIKPEELDLATGVSLIDAYKFGQAEVTSSIYEPSEREIGLIAFVLPVANPEKFYPKHRPISIRRKQVTFFTYCETWSTRAQQDERLPAGWKVHLMPNVTSYGSVIKKQRAMKKAESNIANDMRGSGICVFDGWSTGVLTELMAQAMLSGCVVASVKPNIQTDELSKLFLTLDRPAVMPDEQSMINAVNKALSGITHSELDRQALWAFIYAREKLTFAKRLSDIRMWVHGYREGQRGVMLPFGYSHIVDQLN